MLIIVPARQVLNTSSKGGSATSKDNLFQCFVVPTVKNIFLYPDAISFEVLHARSLLSCHCVLLKRISPSFLYLLFRYWENMITLGPALSLLQAEQAKFLQPSTMHQILQLCDYPGGPPLHHIQHFSVSFVLSAENWTYYSSYDLTNAN